MFTLLVTSGLHSATTAVVVGISPSMAPSAALLAPLTVRFRCKPARTTIFTVTAILKVTATTSTRERCEWDSGLVAATLASRIQTRTQAGRQCRGSSLKRFQKLSSKHVIYWTYKKNHNKVRKLHCCSFISVHINRFETVVSVEQ